MYIAVVHVVCNDMWLDENGWEKAANSEPPMLPDDFNDPGLTVTILRDLFYGYDTLMENVSDPSHIEFAHHKVTGRRDRAKPLPFKLGLVMLGVILDQMLGILVSVLNSLPHVIT